MNAFSGNFKQYNRAVGYAQQLEKWNEKEEQALTPVDVLKRVVHTRRDGVHAFVCSPLPILAGAKEGAKWILWGALTPEKVLTKDVQISAEAWAYSQLQLPNLSLRGVRDATATLTTTTREDYDRTSLAVQKAGSIQAKQSAAAFGISLSISQMLKFYARSSQTELARMVCRSARGAWVVSSACGILYGLKLFDDSMKQGGPFTGTLRDRRDLALSELLPAVQKTEDEVERQGDRVFKSFDQFSSGDPH